MTKKVLQRIAIITVIAALLIVPVLALFESKSGSEFAYEVPRMLGMEGLGEQETARLDGPPSTDVSGPIFEVHGKAVPFNKDLRDLPQTGPKDKKPAREMGVPPNMGPNGNGIDSVLQASGPLVPAPNPSASFAGLDLNHWGAGWPPDTHGDVGLNHYIQVVNTSIGVFDKVSGNRLSAFTFDNFFKASGGNDACATYNYGDPIALYDQVSERWIITDFAFASQSNPPYYECIAVSKTTDPVSGGWWLYTVVADTQSLNDYPKLGIWGDGIYMSANMFKRGRTYSGEKVWALNRDDLISGAALRTVAFNLGNSYFSLLPANFKGANPPAGTPEYFMSDYGSNTSMKLWKFHVDWANPSASTITGPTSFAVASFTRPSQNSVPQKNSNELLDTLGDRLMTWLQYRNIGGTESLWVSRTVVSGNTYGIRWMEVRGMSGTPSVYQQGTYAPDANYRWMPSLAVNQNGDMAVGYSVSSSSLYPAIRYAGRLASDQLGILSQTETSLIEGTGSQSGGYNRWGDYSSMSVDPVDDCTFWYTTEYYTSTGNNWQTRIGSFKLADCSGTPTDNPPTVSITNPSAGAIVANTVNVTANASDDKGVTQVVFKVDGTTIGTDTNGGDGWSASWDTTAYGDGSHTVSAIATDTIGQTGTDSVSVTVQNTTVDNPPTVTITNPSDGATVSSSLSVTADATDDYGVTQVEFFVDGSSIGVDTSVPYSASWDTTTYSDGAHTASAVATDTTGQTNSDSVSVTVQNAAPGTIHVFDLSGSSTVRRNNWNATVTVAVRDSSDNPMANITVTGNWTGASFNGGSNTCITDASGQCSVSTGNIKSDPSVTYTVTDLAGAGYVYDSGANVITSIAVNQ
jgi:hypothetical protein